MNERITDLADQANREGNQYGRIYMDYEKFAELIVRECANVIHNRIGPKSALDILEHFGVEKSQGWICPKCGTDRTKEVCPKGHMAAVTGDCPMTAEAQ
jgi:rubrerythrin